MLNHAISYIRKQERNGEDDRRLLAWAYRLLCYAYLLGMGTAVNHNAAYENCKISADWGSETSAEFLSKFRPTRFGYEFVG